MDMMKVGNEHLDLTGQGECREQVVAFEHGGSRGRVVVFEHGGGGQ